MDTFDKTIIIDYDITKKKTLALISKMEDWQHSPVGKLKVKLSIDSNGGDLDYAFLLYDYFKANKNTIELTTVALAKCFSAAVVVFLTGENKYCYKSSLFMMHEPVTIMEDSLKVSETNCRLTRNIYNRYISLLTEKSNIEKIEWLSNISEFQEYYIKGEDATNNFELTSLL